jgi:hypothetical protein
MQFVKRLRALLPESAVLCDRRVKVNIAEYGMPDYRSEIRRGFELPPLEACRKHYNHVTGVAHTWPAPVRFDELPLPLPETSEPF